MIARIWRGLTANDQADEYLAYLRLTGLKEYRETPGNRGVFVLRRTQGVSAGNCQPEQRLRSLQPVFACDLTARQ